MGAWHPINWAPDFWYQGLLEKSCTKAALTGKSTALFDAETFETLIEFSHLSTRIDQALVAACPCRM
jgi:hypothetical protein